MRKIGTVVRWDDMRGFGFIRGEGFAQDVFLHIRDFRGPAGQGPRQGMSVTFEEVQVGGKGPRAMAVQIANVDRGATTPTRNAPPAQRASRPRRETPVGSGAAFAFPLMLLYVAALVYAVWRAFLPWWALPASAALNLFAFYAYWLDKYAASKRQWRIPEDTLHLWSLAGGWAGAWAAQQVLRHKSSKRAFLATYWLTVILHCAALGGWIWWHS
jgi:uncharacterized membrane protein YsdA (DUF1294 family)/cold shock CspA family protein